MQKIKGGAERPGSRDRARGRSRQQPWLSSRRVRVYVCERSFKVAIAWKAEVAANRGRAKWDTKAGAAPASPGRPSVSRIWIAVGVDPYLFTSPTFIPSPNSCETFPRMYHVENYFHCLEMVKLGAIRNSGISRSLLVD